MDVVPKRTNVFNKTLKKYIPLPVLSYLKEQYIEMKRNRRIMRRKQRMIGGALASPLAIAISSIATSSAKNSSKAKDENATTDISNDKQTEDVVGEASPDANAGANDAGEGTKNDTSAGADDSGTGTGDDSKANGNDDKADAKGDKKKGGFSLGPEIAGDISINSETHEFIDVKRLLDFLLYKGLPYYIQIELKPGTPLKLKDTDIFDLRRILFGKFVKTIDKPSLQFKTGSEFVGISNGNILTNEYPNDIFIFTKDKVTIDKSSDEKSLKVTAKGTTYPPMIDSKRLYKLNGDVPASIDIGDDVGIANITAIDEFRLQVAPLSESDLKSMAAVAPTSANKKKKIVSDDTPSYIVNLNEKCKITSVQTLKKSLEVARLSLEDEDEISKTDAMNVFKTLTGLLQNKDFVKNEGFDDFKESVYGFTYNIPGTEKRKYGFIQLTSFFDQNKEDVPPALTKEFFKLLTLLGHGPAGENGACLAFDTPQSVEVIEYVKTLENGDIVTTKKLGSKTNLEGFGDELNKLNSTNEPKEEEDKGKEAGGEEAGGEEAGGEAGSEGEESKGEGESEEAGGEAGGEEAGGDEAGGEEGESEGEEDTSKDAEGATDEEPVKEETATPEPKPHDNATLPTLDEIEEISAESRERDVYKAYIIKRYKFPTSPEVVLVHFMGWGIDADELIPYKSSRIQTRNESSKVGPLKSLKDTTKEDVLKLYTEERIKFYVEKAEELSKEASDEIKTPAQAKAQATATAISSIAVSKAQAEAS